jgi:DNA-binding response OmpR family regulator
MARILLVEDEPDIREMLQDALQQQHHQVDCAENATRAIELSTINSYELVIVDYVLPGMRGLDLLQKLREVNPFLRSIVMSGQIDHEVLDAQDVEKQLRERIAADRYLPKPVAGERLSEVIKEVLSSITGAQIDWKKVGEDTVKVRQVKTKDIRQVDKTLRKHRKKP